MSPGPPPDPPPDAWRAALPPDGTDATAETSFDFGDVLVVDDHPANVQAVEAALSGLVRRGVAAHSGEEALRALLARDFALILLDVQMPGMDGLETAKLIRSRHRSRRTPIIFITAFERNDAQVLEAYSLGAVDLLFKPVAPEGRGPRWGSSSCSGSSSRTARPAPARVCGRAGT